MPSLTDLQRDAISELLNIGMGRAANALSQMANAEVQLSVPFVYLMPVNYGLTQLTRYDNNRSRRVFIEPILRNSLSG